jgi:hypothetical protein
MTWMELVRDGRAFLLRLPPALWAEMTCGAINSIELLRPGLTERIPEFQPGDVLLLYSPQLPVPEAPPAMLGHVVVVQGELSNFAGYRLGPLYRMEPSLGREQILFAAEQGALPLRFRLLDERTFVVGGLATEERNQFIAYVLNRGIILQVEEGTGAAAPTEPVGEGPGIREIEL